MIAAPAVSFADLRGKAGSVVVAKGRTGLVVKPRTTSPDPKSPAQVRMRQNMTRAVAAFNNLSPEEMESWRTYAATIAKVNPVSGERYHPTVVNAFTALAIKLLQINPDADLPSLPPASAFAPDLLHIAVTAAPGEVTFKAAAPTPENISVELLLQHLPTRHRSPQQGRYRTQAFVTFAPDSLQATVPTPPGYYAAAYRLVHTATGQESPLTPLAAVLDCN
jgi:hypothetical protein